MCRWNLVRPRRSGTGYLSQIVLCSPNPVCGPGQASGFCCGRAPGQNPAVPSNVIRAHSQWGEAAASVWEGTAPSCQIFARSEAAAEPNCNEYSRGCLVLSVNPREEFSFLTSQLGSSSFRSLEHMKHFPRGILIGSTQEIHFCFCEMSQWPSHARDNSSTLAAALFAFVDPVRLPFDLFDYQRVFWWKHLVSRSAAIFLYQSDPGQVCRWPSILPGKVFAHNGSCFSGTASDPGKKDWEAWRAKNTACVEWMRHGGVRGTGDLGWHFSHFNPGLNFLLVSILGHWQAFLPYFVSQARAELCCRTDCFCSALHTTVG